jgi:archaemetzincin
MQARTGFARAAIIGVFLITCGGNAPPQPRKVLLVAIGPVPADAIVHLRSELTTLLKREVAIGPAIPLPALALNSFRRQYRGHNLLVELGKYDFHYADRIVGVIDEDVYAPGLNFIFGQARKPGRVAVVALPRLRDSFRKHPNHPERLRERLVKVAAHEIGHTYGFSHCSDRGCVMHFARSVFDLDETGHNYCGREREVHSRLRF